MRIKTAVHKYRVYFLATLLLTIAVTAPPGTTHSRGPTGISPRAATRHENNPANWFSIDQLTGYLNLCPVPDSRIPSVVSDLRGTVPRPRNVDGVRGGIITFNGPEQRAIIRSNSPRKGFWGGCPETQSW